MAGKTLSLSRLAGLMRAKKTAAFIAVGLVGAAALVLGLAWDSYLHAQDPTLAQREGLFTLANPGHVLLGVGIVLVDIGLLGAAYTILPLGRWGRRSFVAGALGLMVISGAKVASAASTQWSFQHQGAVVVHLHDRAANAQPTDEQLQAAAQLIAQTRAAVEKYRDQRLAVAAGYKPMEPPGVEILHFVNSAYLTDADVLKPEHVQSLIYYNGPRGPVLIGAMYIMPRIGSPGPEIGGPLTSWHHHDDICFDKQTNVAVAFVGDSFFDRADKSRSCPPGSSKKLTPEMLHVWLVDNPRGPFDSDMDPVVLRSVILSPVSK